MPTTAYSTAEKLRRERRLAEGAEPGAERRADEQRGREHAARRAGAEADGGGDQLADEQRREQQDDLLVAVEDRLDGGVADAGGVQMAGDDEEAVGEHADDHHADDVLGVGVAGELGEKVLAIGEHADEGEGGEARRDAEDDEAGELDGRQRRRRRHRGFRHEEGRVEPEDQAGDRGRGGGRHHHRQEGAVADLRQQQFDREHHPAERRVEGGGDARPGAGRQQRDLLPAGERQLAGEGRAEGGADLDDRPLAADPGARADRDRRGDRLHDRDDAAHVPLVVVDRVHHLRHAVALGLRREGLHQPDHDQAADDRRQDDERPPGIGGIEVVGVVDQAEGAEEEDVVDHRDHRAEHDRAEGGDDADEEGEDDQGGQANGPRIRLEIRPFRPTRWRPGGWCRSWNVLRPGGWRCPAPSGW